MKKIAQLLAPLLLIVVLGLPQIVFIMDETQQGIITKLGKYQRTITEPGLKFKVPFLETIHKFDRRILISDAEPEDYLTRDKKRVVVDHITRWQIINPLVFFKTMRGEETGRQRLNAIVVSALRKELALHEFTDVISSKRDAITTAVIEGSAERAKEFGVEVRDVRIKRADLPKEVQQSVFARMVAERSRIAKRYRSEGEEEAAKIRAQTDKEKAILLARAYEEAQQNRGEGDALSTKIYADSYGKDAEFYRFVRSLELYEAGFTEGTMLILSGKEKFLQYLVDSKEGSRTP